MKWKLYRKKITFQLLAFVSLLMLHSCMYTLDDFYENKVEKNVGAPDISVVNLDLDADTVFAYSDRNINFQFKSDDHQIQGVKLLIDGRVVDSVASNEGKLKFYNYSLTDSIHSLELRIYTNSGTGSIADKLGAESWSVSKKWVLVVDHDFSNNLSYAVKDGYLHVVSKKSYRSSDFDCYVLQTNWWSYNEVARSKTQDITDSLYIGEGGNFAVYVKQKDGSMTYWGEIKLPSEISDVYFGSRSDKDFYLWWHRSRYYNAMKGYKYSMNYGSYSQLVNEADTVLNLPNIRFKDYINFTLEFIPKSSDLTNSTSNNYLKKYYYDYAAYKFKTTDQYFYRIKQTGIDEICWADNDTIYKYNISSLKYSSKQRILEGYGAYGTTSAHADYYQGYYASVPNNFVYFAKNMKTGKLMNINSYDSYSGGISQSCPISDNGMFIISNLNSDILMGMEAGSPMYINSHPNRPTTEIKISANGQFFMYNSDSLRICKGIQGTSGVQKILTIGNISSPDFYQFNSENSNQVIVSHGQKLTVYQCQPLAQLNSFTLPASEEVIYIDYYKNEVLCGYTNMFRIRSLITGEILYELPTQYTPSQSGYNYLINHTLITVYGYYIKLNY